MESNTIAGKPTSLWLDTIANATYPILPGDIECDVAILGGGLAGLTALDLLAHSGKRVVLVEAGQLAAGVSGFTTAKITSLHTLIYKDLMDRFGSGKARLYGEANEWAIRHIADNVSTLGIDCDFVRDTSYTYAVSDETEQKARDEAEAARSLGLPASFVTETSLPFSLRGAVKFEHQARFHPRKYLLALAAAASDNGAQIYENTRAVDVEEEDTGCTVITEHGRIRAGFVLVLTHYPIHDPAMFFARLSPQRSYAFAVRVNGRLPEGMYISADEPERSVRRASYEGQDVLIIGGEVHKTGQEEDTTQRYHAVAEWARQNFDVAEFLYHWSTQDPKTLDGVPYIGRVRKGTDRVFMASGFDGWGMTGATVAGKLLSDVVQGIHNPWEELYDPNRSELKAAGSFVSENVNVAKHLIGDKLSGAPYREPQTLKAGEAAVMRSSSGAVAGYRDDNGSLHVVSPNCTHMGCTLHWNMAERSWDCPCHGSRFGPDGNVLHGPALTNLESKM